MPNNFFPDGFPMTPVEAINASASLGFLTADEQQGWFKWLETSTLEQQQELVETLHLIFIDHQKQNSQNQAAGSQRSQSGQNQFDNTQNYQNNSQNQSQFGNQQNQPNFAQNNWQHNPQTPQPQRQQFSNFNQNNQNNSQFEPQNNDWNRQNSNSSNPQIFNPSQNQQNQPNQFDERNSQNNYQNSPQSTQSQFGNNQNTSFNEDDFARQQSEYQRELDSFENNKPQNPVQNKEELPVQNNENEFQFDEPKPEKENFEQNSDNPYSNKPSEESFLNLANSKYTPNPILDNDEPTPKEFIYQNDSPKLEQSEEKPEEKETAKVIEKSVEKIITNPKNDTKITVKEKTVQKISEPIEPPTEFADESDDFSFEDGDDDKNGEKKHSDIELVDKRGDDSQITKPTSISQTASKPFYSAPEKTQLEEIYNQFVLAQKKKMDDQQEFSSHKLILDEDAWSKQSEFFGKVMEVMSNYEQMTDSLLKLNAQNIELARKIKVLENATQIRPSSSSVQRVLDGLSIDIKNLSRDFDDFRTDIYSQQRDISEQVAAATADTFKSDGIKQQIDLLANRITRMETQR